MQADSRSVEGGFSLQHTTSCVFELPHKTVIGITDYQPYIYPKYIHKLTLRKIMLNLITDKGNKSLVTESLLAEDATSELT